MSGLFGVSLPQTMPPMSTAHRDERPRCIGPHPKYSSRPCGHVLANAVTRPWSITCRCGFINERE